MSKIKKFIKWGRGTFIEFTDGERMFLSCISLNDVRKLASKLNVEIDEKRC